MDELAMYREEYEEARAIYEKLVLAAILVSDLSSNVKTTRSGIESTKIYTRITLCAMTINALLPGNSINHTALWDFPSIATLARSFAEVCHRYLYLSELNLSAEDSSFRLSLYYYHLNIEKYKLHCLSASSTVNLEEFAEKLSKAKAGLMEYATYRILDKKRAKDVRCGNVSMHLTDDEASTTFGLLSGKFRQMYKLLSNHAHGEPFATFSQSNERGRGIENETETMYVQLILLMLNQYLSKAVLNQATLLSLQEKAPDEFRYCFETLKAASK
jgi:hypothetical protein